MSKNTHHKRDTVEGGPVVPLGLRAEAKDQPAPPQPAADQPAERPSVTPARPPMPQAPPPTPVTPLPTQQSEKKDDETPFPQPTLAAAGEERKDETAAEAPATEEAIKSNATPSYFDYGAQLPSERAELARAALRYSQCYPPNLPEPSSSTASYPVAAAPAPYGTAASAAYQPSFASPYNFSPFTAPARPGIGARPKPVLVSSGAAAAAASGRLPPPPQPVPVAAGPTDAIVRPAPILISAMPAGGAPLYPSAGGVASTQMSAPPPPPPHPAQYPPGLPAWVRPAPIRVPSLPTGGAAVYFPPFGVVPPPTAAWLPPRPAPILISAAAGAVPPPPPPMVGGMLLPRPAPFLVRP